MFWPDKLSERGWIGSLAQRVDCFDKIPALKQFTVAMWVCFAVQRNRVLTSMGSSEANKLPQRDLNPGPPGRQSNALTHSATAPPPPPNSGYTDSGSKDAAKGNAAHRNAAKRNDAGEMYRSTRVKTIRCWIHGPEKYFAVLNSFTMCLRTCWHPISCKLITYSWWKTWYISAPFPQGFIECIYCVAHENNLTETAVSEPSSW